MKKVTLNVPDISCSHCERTIVGALVGQNGIIAVKVTTDKKTVEVSFDETRITLETIVDIIEDAGYDVAE